VHSMEKIRVLVVDDSLVIRRALRECFRADPEIEVVGVADTGVRALEQIEALHPDVVTLDIEMPEMDGLETLRNLKARGSSVPVIMFSKYTTEGATASLEALLLGASDVVAKPEAQGGTGAACDVVKRQLTTRIRALGRKARRGREKLADLLYPSGSVSKESFIYEAPGQIDAIGLAISTGGPRALIDIVSALDPTLPAPIFITQHMPPVFTRFLAERLSARGALSVHEATEGMLVEPGNIYIAPGNFHMEAQRGDDGIRIGVSQAPHENSCRPSADVMFRSLASAYGPRLMGLVMTGMGQDGKKGCEVIKAHGGTIIAQDEASSLVWGMPRAVVTAGLHDAVVPLSHIAAIINKSCQKRQKEK
jgi:two-component system chemotaxis response regulator CheB